MIFKKPDIRVDKKYLIGIAGLMWGGVGIMLISLAAGWLMKYHGGSTSLYALAGFILAMPIHHFGFLRLADRNLSRLLSLKEKKSAFMFITRKSYLTIIIMIALGITLRNTSIPRQYLAILYIGIGLGLFLSGIRYVRYFFKQLLNKKTTEKSNN